MQWQTYVAPRFTIIPIVRCGGRCSMKRSNAALLSARRNLFVSAVRISSGPAKSSRSWKIKRLKDF